MRDFLLHLLTITIGLLIALALESLVESIHFRHLVRDARHSLAREMNANRSLFAQNQRALEEDRELLENDIAQLRTLRSAKSAAAPDLHFRFGWNRFSDTAWKSARESGALVHMDPEIIEEYDGVYSQQEYVNQAGVGILMDHARVASPLLIAQDHKDSRELLPNEVETMLLACAELEARVQTLQQLMKPIAQDYAQAPHEPSADH